MPLKHRYLGRLPGNNNRDTYVGIDLDRAVGNGTGLYSGKHLFHTKQNHAALVPLSGILPANLAEVHTSPESNHSYEVIYVLFELCDVFAWIEAGFWCCQLCVIFACEN